MFNCRITDSEIDDDIITLLMLAGRTTKQTLMMLNSTPGYIEKRVRKLRDIDKLIKQTKQGEITLNPTRVKNMEAIPKDIVEYYDKYTAHADGYPGRHKEHQERNIRTAEVMLMMQGAGIDVGVNHPSMMDITDHVKSKNDASKKTFYQNKELMYDKEQRESRQTITRSYGVLMSQNMMGPVYNIGEADQLMNITPEIEAGIRAKAITRELYSNLALSRTVEGHAIVIHNGPDTMKRIVTKAMEAGANVIASRKRTRPLSEIILDIGITKTEYHMIETSRSGMMLLRTMTSVPEQAIRSLAFSTDEIQRAKNTSPMCDGITSTGLQCVEFMTSNITKLMYARRHLQTIGIVCSESQIETLRQCFGGVENGVRYRCIRDAALERECLRYANESA